MWYASSIFFVAVIFYGKEASATPPNIVMVLADDLGWNDVSWHNSFVQTPNLQALANEGIILNNAYAQQVCTPSRAALLTGQYPVAIGMQEGVVAAQQLNGLPLSLTLLPQHLKDTANYATHMVGKWHLGFCSDAYNPLQRGFDSHYGFYNGGISYSSHIADEGSNSGYDYRNNTELNYAADGEYSTTDFTDVGVSLIEAHDQSNPLFLYMAYNAPHSPFEVDQAYSAQYMPTLKFGNRKTFLGMVSFLDEQVQRLVDTLKAQNMWDNTIFVFYSDNGGVGPSNGQGGNNYPLRGKKGTLYEGGYRVPAFVVSPLLQQTGYQYEGLVHITDLYTTFIEEAGGSVASDVDGLNIWNSISNNLPSPRDEIVYNIIRSEFANNRRTADSAAIRVGNYKLIEGNPGGLSGLEGWTLPKEGGTDVIGSPPTIGPIVENGIDYHLFNLLDDPYETVNLVNTDTSAFTDMKAHLEAAKARYQVQAIDDATSSDPNDFPPANWDAWVTGFC